MIDKPAYLLMSRLPSDLVYKIHLFVPKYPKQKEISPSMQKQLTKIQHMTLKGKNAMYMKDLEDFCLD